MVAEGTGRFIGAVGPDRRTFLKGLVGTAFAAPMLTSFTMSGIEAVFGPVGQHRGLVATPNTTPKHPDYTTSIGCLLINGNQAGSTTFTDGSKQVMLQVPAGSFSSGVFTNVCVMRGNLAGLADWVPDGETPVSAYGVVWTNTNNQRPNSNQPIKMTVSDPDVEGGDPIYEADSSTPVPAGTAAAGNWQVSFTIDPHYAVTHAEETPPTPPSSGGSTAADAVVAEPETTG